VRYFEKPGPVNTDAVIDLVCRELAARGLTHVVVAGTGGDSAAKLLPRLPAGVKLVVVSHNVGFLEEGKVPFDPAIRERITAAGHVVLTGTMATRNINKAISTRLGGYSETEIINAVMRMFGQGMKVCPEIAAMAADSGLIPFGDVIAVAGTGRGWDTAVVIRANSSNRYFDQKIREVLCKPADF
jgi:uncharacterized protein